MAEEQVKQATLATPKAADANPDGVNLGSIYDIPVEVSAVLGRTNMPVSQLLKLGRGAVITLDRRVGEAIDIYFNNRLVARGEVVIVENKIGVTMTEVIKFPPTTKRSSFGSPNISV